MSGRAPRFPSAALLLASGVGAFVGGAVFGAGAIGLIVMAGEFLWLFIGWCRENLSPLGPMIFGALFGGVLAVIWLVHSLGAQSGKEGTEPPPGEVPEP